MIEVYSKALDASFEVEDRIVDHIEGTQPGPTVIFIGGLHGNEPSGLFALRQVFHELKGEGLPVRGDLFTVAGNMWALEHQKRYQKDDLNRLWTKERINKLRNGNIEIKSEEDRQQQELFETLTQIIDQNRGPFYILDLHTTSSSTAPFIVANDVLTNRNFATQFPAPVILGLEEYIEGPLMNFFNELGYVALAFEAGQHDALSSIENHTAFIYLVLEYTGAVPQGHLANPMHQRTLIKETSELADQVYEINFRFETPQHAEFRMKPGYLNFQHIHKGEELAVSDGKPVITSEQGQIFMPLYQAKGDDGFFVIREVSSSFLTWSTRLRKSGWLSRLHMLPGITKEENQPGTYRVNRSMTRFLTGDVLRYLGFRIKHLEEDTLIIHSQEEQFLDSMYKNAPWQSEK